MTLTLKSTNRRPFFGKLGFGAWLCLFVAALWPARVFALGFRIPNQDAAAIARGNAFAATADNPSAIYYNPAGITQLEGHNFQFGILNYLGINTHYESPAGSESDTDFELIPVPQLHYVYSPQDCQLSFGLGVYAPFGLGVKWPEDSGLRSLAIESRLQYVTLNPVVAWQPHPTLSLAIGPTLNYSQVEFTRGLIPGFGPPDFFKFKGNDFSFGFNAGLRWQPDPRFSIGANFHSASTMDYDGTSSYYSTALDAKAKTKARVPFPQIISGGISYRPTPKWNIEVGVDYTDWNTLNTVQLAGSKDLGIGPALGLPAFDLPVQFDWHGSWFFELGVTRQFDNGWFVSGGYFYSGETAPDNTYTPAVPDTELHVGSLGVGHEGERWTWVVAMQIIAGPARNVTGSQQNPFSGESPDGKYQLFVPTVSFSIGYRF